MKNTTNIAICINNQTVGNLKEYLKGFPDDATVIVWVKEKKHDLVIAINTEKQIEINQVQFLVGEVK